MRHGRQQENANYLAGGWAGKPGPGSWHRRLSARRTKSRFERMAADVSCRAKPSGSAPEQGLIKLGIGPRTVPVRSGPDGSWGFPLIEHSGLFLRVANQIGRAPLMERGAC